MVDAANESGHSGQQGSKGEPQQPRASRLPNATDRFLSLVLEHSLATGLRTPAEFLHAFSPATIMKALAEHPTRRAHILEKTVGIRPRVGLRKSPESSGEDLQIALDEGETDAATVLTLFEADDRVRFLDAPALWSFVWDSRYWSTPPPPEELALVHRHTAFILATAVEQDLLTGPDIIRAISVQTLVQHLPRDEVATIIERAIAEREVLTEAKLFEAIGFDMLARNVPLATTWEWVIGAKIAVPLGLVGDNEELFDEREAHPDAQTHEVTVILDPADTQPEGKLAIKS
jgi:hypothetical protein